LLGDGRRGLFSLTTLNINGLKVRITDFKAIYIVRSMEKCVCVCVCITTYIHILYIALNDVILLLTHLFVGQSCRHCWR